MYLNRLGITDGQLCASVARAIVQDAATENLATGAFPEISAQRADEGFLIQMRVKGHCRSFNVTDAEARNMVEAMRLSKHCGDDVFDRIQEAIAQLEGDVLNAPDHRPE